MRQIKEVLRLHDNGRSHREIATALRLSRATVWEYLDRARRARLELGQAIVMDDDALDHLLFPPAPSSKKKRPMPEWVKIHRELGRKHVTLDLLWNEYKVREPEGYGYSWFCEHYERWAASLPVTLRQTLTPGEKLFVDYSGTKFGIVNPDTGEIREAELFVAALGVSGCIFAELTWTQQLPDWIASHVRAFAFYGGVVEIVVPDNLKSAVHKPDFYDPALNRTYGDMASHYGVAIIPARPRKPRDKPKAELSVLLAQRWILARLRHQRFFSLKEANRAIAALLVEANNKKFKKLTGSRRSVFEELDRPALRPLPERPYQFAQWKGARIGIDYHAELAGHYYSVPYRYAREQVDVRYTQNTVEIFHRGQRIAAHGRSDRRGHHTTIRGAHACASSGCNDRMEPATAASLGNRHRSAHRRCHPASARTTPASTAGLPHLSWHPEHGQTLRARPPGSRKFPGRGAERHELQVHLVDPEKRTGECRRSGHCPARTPAHACQCARAVVLPLKQENSCYIIRPSNDSTNCACLAWRRRSPNSNRRKVSCNSALRSGLACSSSERRPSGNPV
jgi:transposase